MKSCLDINSISMDEVGDEVWGKLWKANIYARLKVFLWKALTGVLPLRDVVVRRLRDGDASCGLCGADQESLFHLFKECPGSGALAYASKWGFWLEG